MVLSNYETVFIADPNIANDQVDQIVNKIKQSVTARGGTMTNEDRWGRRRLAYPIHGHREGFYVVLTYSAEGPVVSDLEHYFRVTDPVLRYLTTKVIKRNKTFAPRRERPAGADSARPGSRPYGRRPEGASRPLPTVTPPPAASPAVEAPKTTGAAS